MAAEAEPGSIKDTVSRLVLWCRRAEQGFIRAVYHDGASRDLVIRQLKDRLTPHDVAFHRLDLPTAPNADALALRLADELSRLGAGVICLTGFERSLPPSGPDLEEALLALNSRRENFAFPGQHTIWWFPHHIALALIREHRDLNSWFLRRVELTETLLSPEEIEIQSQHHEAIRLSNAASYTEAEPILREILSTQEATYGSEDPQLIPALNNLGTLLISTNRLTEAENLLRRSLSLQTAKYGNNHVITAHGLSSLARLLHKTSRYVEAENLARQALVINEEKYGADHSAVGSSLSLLAGLLNEAGRGQEAEPLLRRALTIQEHAFGPHHNLVADIAGTLGTLLIDEKKYADAETLLRRALTINKESYGSDHPIVADKLNSLAGLFHLTGRREEAEETFRKALEIDINRLGPEHPDVANRLYNLGMLVFNNGLRFEAKSLLLQSLSIFAASSTNAGHFVTGIERVARNYRGLLILMGTPKAEVEKQMIELLKQKGLSRQKAKQLART